MSFSSEFNTSAALVCPKSFSSLLASGCWPRTIGSSYRRRNDDCVPKEKGVTDQSNSLIVINKHDTAFFLADLNDYTKISRALTRLRHNIT